MSPPLPDSAKVTPATPISRGLFGALALVDAAALAYLVLDYGWLNFHIPQTTESPAAILIIPVLWVLSVGEKLFFATFFIAIGAGIVRELTARRESPRWRAVLASLVLLLALAGIAMVWIRIASTVIEGPPGFVVDRLTFFDGVAKNSEGGGGMFGFSGYSAGSTGAFLLYMLIAAYLAEKYLLSWWRVRWPIPLLPLLAIGWVAWSVHQGEQGQRIWVAAQQWRPVAAQQPWVDAVGSCESIGPEWRLPRRSELSLYLATRPADTQAWTGAAWTSSAAEGGSRAIVVDLQPRKSGRWNKRSEQLRDESLCETRDLQGLCERLGRRPPTPCVRIHGPVSGAVHTRPQNHRAPARQRSIRATGGCHDLHIVRRTRHEHWRWSWARAIRRSRSSRG